MFDLTTSSGPSIPYFTGSYLPFNLGHAALGFGVVYMDPIAQLVTGAGFLAYELFREKSVEDRIGSLAEFMTGYVLGVISHG